MNVLVSIDFSEVSEEQLAIVGRMARGMKRSIYLVHVAEPEPDFIGFEPGPDVVRDQLAEEFRDEHRKIQAMADRLRDDGIDATALLLQGSIVETVLEKADELDARMIVVGSHGHGAAYDLLVGSVSRGIIRGATVPVLVVPARKDA